MRAMKAGGAEPLNKWTHPSCVLMSESNYSDAFIFAIVFAGIGVLKKFSCDTGFSQH